MHIQKKKNKEIIVINKTKTKSYKKNPFALNNDAMFSS